MLYSCSLEILNSFALNLCFISEVQWDSGASAPMILLTATSLPPLSGFSPLPHSAPGRAQTREKLGLGACTPRPPGTGHGGSCPHPELTAPWRVWWVTGRGKALPLIQVSDASGHRRCNTLGGQLSALVGVPGKKKDPGGPAPAGS